MGVGRRTISNEEFNEAYKNKDNENVIMNAGKRYLGVLSREDIAHCGINALWRALQGHKPNLGNKFTTSLHRFMIWECKRELKSRFGTKRKDSAIQQHLSQNVGYSNSESEARRDDLDHIRAKMAFLPAEHQFLINQYYFDGKSLEQIGKRNGYTKEFVRQKLKAALQSLRELCLSGV